MSGAFAGDGGASSTRFDEQLATGEFAPALESARQVADVHERDARLAAIAIAQSKSGARNSAISTLANVSDDRTRYSAIQQTRESQPPSGRAGGAQADFTSLIELIQSTVAPTTWDEVGGPGSISEFRNGVYIDSSGELKRALRKSDSGGVSAVELSKLASKSARPEAGYSAGDARRSSVLRKISLPRLEKHVQLLLAQGKRPSDEILNLAGLEKIRYVFVYPDTGDLVLAGPAGDWRPDEEGRTISAESGRPIIQLDDLVVVLRYLKSTPGATFGCSIDPTTQGLARTRQFAEQSSAHPIKPAERGAWLKRLRQQMGAQTISVEGLDPRTRAARVLVEADYRMKLVGMGLEKGTADVPSYLDLVRVERGQAPPPLDVLRWWFTLRYDAVKSTENRDAFELRGPGVRVESENEHLTNLGHRVHTGKAEPLNQEFASRFNKHFPELAQKYPVYADLQNICDLALVSALITSQGLGDRVGWHFTCFGNADEYAPALGPAPHQVQTVINHRVIGGKHIIVGVSGGVSVSPWQFVKTSSIKTDTYGKLEAEQRAAAAGQMPADAWWWD
ncbi:MAG TPA: DUF1598 domain-containing protein [Pirellulales bacterium]